MDQTQVFEKPFNFHNLMQQLQDLPIASTISLAYDSFYLGYQCGKFGKNEIKIQEAIQIIENINSYLEADILGFEDKINFYHMNIDLDQDISFLKNLQKNKNEKSQEKLQIEFEQIKSSLIMQSQYLDQVCTICQDKMNINNIQLLFGCPHLFHKECLRLYIKSKSQLPINCPEINCNNEINFDDIRQLVEKEFIQKLEQQSFQQYVLQNQDNLFQCPTPNCQMVVEILDSKFNCPLCHMEYCTKCRKKYHEGICGEQSFIQIAKKRKMKQCQKCKFWVEKSEGCKHMTCRCGNEFCYQCGRDWNRNAPCTCSELGLLNRVQEIFDQLF